MILKTDTSEKEIQQLIVKHLVEEHNYRVIDPNEFDREFCINKADLMEFIRESQLDTYIQIQEYNLNIKRIPFGAYNRMELIFKK